MLLSYCRGIRAHLSLRGQSHSVSLVEAGSFGFLSSCDRDFSEPLVLLQGSQASFQDARGTSGFLLSRCRGIGPHLRLRQETQGSSPGISGFLSSFNRGVRLRLVLRHGTPLSVQGVKGVSGLLRG